MIKAMRVKPADLLLSASLALGSKTLTAKILSVVFCCSLKPYQTQKLELYWIKPRAEINAGMNTNIFKNNGKAQT